MTESMCHAVPGEAITRKKNIFTEKGEVGGEWRGEEVHASPKFVTQKDSISDCSDIQNAAKRIEKLAQAELQLFYS